MHTSALFQEVEYLFQSTKYKVAPVCNPPMLQEGVIFDVRFVGRCGCAASAKVARNGGVRVMGWGGTRYGDSWFSIRACGLEK